MNCKWTPGMFGWSTSCGGREIREEPGRECPWCGEYITVAPTKKPKPKAKKGTR